MAGPFENAVWLVTVPFCSMFTIVLCGVFDNVTLELGLLHYAEMPWFPLFNVMPLNTVINLGYIGLGLFWCSFTSNTMEQGLMKDRDALLFYVFNIMALCYGCVQLLRILSHHVLWAVLDQWCTLPFLSLVCIWSLYITRGWSSSRAWAVMITSIASYSLALVTPIGFEIVLGVHILCAIGSGVKAYQRYPAAETLATLFQAILSCSGFVFLKLFDHRLVQISSIFKYVSGHFLSKICDIYQIHLVNNFFLDITLEKSALSNADEKQQNFNNYGVGVQRQHPAVNNDFVRFRPQQT